MSPRGTWAGTLERLPDARSPTPGCDVSGSAPPSRIIVRSSATAQRRHSRKRSGRYRGPMLRRRRAFGSSAAAERPQNPGRFRQRAPRQEGSPRRRSRRAGWPETPEASPTHWPDLTRGSRRGSLIACVPHVAVGRTLPFAAGRRQAQRAGGGGETDPGAVSRAVSGPERASLLADGATRRGGEGVVHVRQGGASGGGPRRQAQGAWSSTSASGAPGMFRGDAPPRR